jgi:hypothetical protein
VAWKVEVVLSRVKEMVDLGKLEQSYEEGGAGITCAKSLGIFADHSSLAIPSSAAPALRFEDGCIEDIDISRCLLQPQFVSLHSLYLFLLASMVTGANRQIMNILTCSTTWLGKSPSPQLSHLPTHENQ